MNVIGRIYRIFCLITNETYIGHTIKLLEERMNGHRSPSNKTSSRRIIERGNYTYNTIVEITLNEYYIHNNGKDIEHYLLEKEQFYMDITPNLINNNKALLTPLEKLNYNVDYRVRNNAKCKAYDEASYDCPCGGKLRKNYPKGHMITAMHKNHVADWDNEIEFFHFVKDHKWGTREKKIVDIDIPLNTVELLNIEVDNKYMDTLKNDLLHQYIKRLIRYENGYKLMGGFREYF